MAFSCPRAFAVDFHDSGLSPAEIKTLEAKAAKGDGQAAYELSAHYAFYAYEDGASDKWLRIAAKLGYPQAQRWLAYMIRKNGGSYREFGPDARSAVLSLGTAAAKTQGDACEELASAYAEGYFGKADHAKAREYFQQGAKLGNRMCWTEYADYCWQGKGGPRDLSQGFYWISLEARCVDPRSISGNETWTLREKVAAGLTSEEFQNQLRRVDSYITKVRDGRVVLDDPPFGGTTIQKSDSIEGRRLADQWEANFRARWIEGAR